MDNFKGMPLSISENCLYIAIKIDLPNSVIGYFNFYYPEGARAFRNVAVNFRQEMEVLMHIRPLKSFLSKSHQSRLKMTLLYQK